MRQKGLLFLTLKCQLINVEGMISLENYNLTTLTLKTDSGKNDQWMQNLWVRV